MSDQPNDHHHTHAHEEERKWTNDNRASIEMQEMKDESYGETEELDSTVDHDHAHSSPDEDDNAHVRRPSLGFPTGKQRYAKLEPPELRVQRISIHSAETQIDAPHSDIATSNSTHDSSDQPKLPPPPCFENPLLLCITIFGIVFILCGILVGIALRQHSGDGREGHVAIYNAVVEEWNHPHRAVFAHAAFSVVLESPQAALPPLTRTNTEQSGSRGRQLMQTASESSTASNTSIPVNASTAPSDASPSSSSSTASDQPVDTTTASSAGSTTAATAAGSSSADAGSPSSTAASSTANDIPSSTGDTQQSSTASAVSSTASPVDSSTASVVDSSTASIGSSTGSQSLSSTGAESASSTGSPIDSSTGATVDSSTAIADSSTGPAPFINSPTDPWLVRNHTSLVKVTTADVLNDAGPDVAKYAPLYFALTGTPPETPQAAQVTPNPTSAYREIPPLLQRNHSHPRPWIDREDFSLNATRINFLGHYGTSTDLSELSISLPFLRQDLTKTSAAICSSKLQGTMITHDTCLSFRQLTGICVRVKQLSKDELLTAQEQRRLAIEAALAANGTVPAPYTPLDTSTLAQNVTRYVFDTDELEGWNELHQDDDEAAVTASTTDVLSSSTSTTPEWHDVLGPSLMTPENVKVSHPVDIPGCTRHAGYGWQVGVYSIVPVAKYTMHQPVPSATVPGQVWHVMRYDTTKEMHEVVQADEVPMDLLLIGLNIGAFNLSIRDRNDPYLMAQSLTRSSLWFGFPTSELVGFTVILIFIGLLLEIAPCFYGARWWTLRKRALAGEFDDEDEDGSSESGEDGDTEEEELNLTDDEEGRDLERGGVQMTEITVVPTKLTAEALALSPAKDFNSRHPAASSIPISPPHDIPASAAHPASPSATQAEGRTEVEFELALAMASSSDAAAAAADRSPS